ncbi:MAG: restriction endonuclease [Chloroflexota bacterium]|nr:restriction endonuclease [Chloroflexota bacterium]
MIDREDKSTVWRMTLGKDGQYESDALENNVVFVGFGIEEDLAGKSEEQILRMVEERWPSRSEGQNRSSATKLSMLVNRMEVGDLVVVYLKKQLGNLAVGRVVGDYEFDASKSGVPHTREIEWVRTSLSISDGWEPLLFYVRERSTINPVRHEETIARVRRAVKAGAAELEASSSTDDSAREAEPKLPVSDLAKLQVAALIHERFPGKEMERLVAGVLQAEGYTTAPPVGGADQGVDVIAGHGLLGFEDPMMCVQVKHTIEPTSAEAVQRLRGAIDQFGARQGLFVSWGGYKSTALAVGRQSFFRIRFWDANDLIDAVCRNYGNLSTELRAEIPLQQVWAVVPDDDEA